MSRRVRWGLLLLALPLGLLVGLLLWPDEAPPSGEPAPVAQPEERTPPAPLERTPPPPDAPLAMTDESVDPRSLEEQNVVVSEYHPRPAEEWQGMRVNLALRATCERSAGCGLAMACRDGLCGPCEEDAHCASGEVCVLDHCVQRAKAACRGRADCGEDALCVLSGYSDDPRNNQEMRAECLVGRGGEPEAP